MLQRPRCSWSLHEPPRNGLTATAPKGLPAWSTAGVLAVPASTVHAVLTRCRINRLSHLDRVTGEPLRRYEHAYPGSLIHVDVTKFANIPDGGGHKFVSRQLGERNAIQTA
jgi:hypothetical protein